MFDEKESKKEVKEVVVEIKEPKKKKRGRPAKSRNPNFLFHLMILILL